MRGRGLGVQELLDEGLGNRELWGGDFHQSIPHPVMGTRMDCYRCIMVFGECMLRGYCCKVD